MTDAAKEDLKALSKINAQFIRNYVSQDTASHNQIIAEDFVCIQNSGEIMERDEYMKDWATSYGKSGFTSFEYSDEKIRLFGSTALVRSKTTYSKIVGGKTIRGSSIYTDTYIKKNGRWRCVQAQITPIQ